MAVTTVPAHPPCAGHPLDFTEIHARSAPEVLAKARATCAACPLLLACLDYLETTEPAGLAGGMLPHQRARWRARDGLARPSALTIADVSEATELQGSVLDVVPVREGRGTMSPALLDVIRRLTEAGFSAEEIAGRLSGHGVTDRTVNYIRRTYLTDQLTERRKAAQHRDRPDIVDRDVIIAWATAQGIAVKPYPGGAVPPKIVAAYHRAHSDGEESSAC